MSPNARDRARAKRRYVKRQARLEQRAKSRRTRQQVAAAVFGVLIVVVGVFGVTRWLGPSDQKPSAAAAGSSPSASAAAGQCPKVTAKTNPKPQQFTTAPAKSLAAGRTWTATVETSCGTITLALDGAKAPQTVASFVFLAQKGYFADTSCHRLTTSGLYVLQCGDPTGSGSGGPGYGFGIENAPKTGDYPAGTLAMARSTSPTSNGSQFFIVYKDSKLPTDGGGYSIFGTVKSGLDVVNKVAAAGVSASGGSTGDGAPATPINITSVSVK